MAPFNTARILKWLALCIIGPIIAILLGVGGYMFYVDYHIMRDPGYFYEKSFMVKWHEMVDEYWKQVRNHEIPLNDVYELMKQEGMTVAEVDSMLGDSLWRVTNECEE